MYNFISIVLACHTLSSPAKRKVKRSCKEKYRITQFKNLHLQCPSALSSCPGGHTLMLLHLYDPFVFSHFDPRRQECCPVEHSSTSKVFGKRRYH